MPKSLTQLKTGRPEPEAPASPAADLLETVVTSLRSRKALAAAGFETVGDLRAPGALKRALEVRYVGETTRMELERAAGPEALRALDAAEDPEQVEDDAGEVEEGPQPLLLRCRGKHLRVVYLPSHRVEGPGRTWAIEDPLWLEFEPWTPKGGGVARLTREMFLMRKYDRDRKRVRQAVQAGEPWRKEAAEDLKRFTRFGIDFFVMTD